MEQQNIYQGSKNKLMRLEKSLFFWGWVLIIFGWASIVCGIFLLISSPLLVSPLAVDIDTDEYGESLFWVTLLMGCFFTLFGVAHAFIGKRVKDRVKIYKKFRSIVINHKIYSVDELSGIMRFTFEKTEKTLQKMIGLGFFPNSYYDYKNHRIVVPFSASNDPGNPMQFMRSHECFKM